MKLTPYNNPDEFRLWKRCNNQRIIEEFVESGLDCARIDDYPQSSARSARNALSASIRRLGYRNIKVCVRGKNVFLLRMRD